MIAKALYSSRREDWRRPQELFERLHKTCDFQLDAAASASNAKCRSYFTKQDDALAQSRVEYARIRLNPPYGRAIGEWMQKAHEESRRGHFKQK